MSKFLLKSALFLFTIIIFVLVFFAKYQYTYNTINHKSNINTIFIWGDSQANKGLNLDVIRKLTGKEVYSAARGGAGVYDFLVFTETVPDNSIVVLSISQLAQLRSRDKNSSGIPVKHLFELYMKNFTNLLPSIRNNIHPRQLYSTVSTLYPYRDSLTFHEPISKFKEIYSNNPGQMKVKQFFFLEGVSELIAKGCKISFVEFPFHPILSDVMNISESREGLLLFKKELLALFKSVEIDSINVKTNKRLMYDLTHLNENGATEVTTKVFTNDNRINRTATKYYIINKGICE